MKYKTNAEVEQDMRADPAWKSYFSGMDALSKQAEKAVETKKKQDEFLKELGFKLTFDDVISLLKDEERLKTVVSKLKLKVFW